MSKPHTSFDIPGPHTRSGLYKVPVKPTPGSGSASKPSPRIVRQQINQPPAPAPGNAANNPNPPPPPPPPAAPGGNNGSGTFPGPDGTDGAVKRILAKILIPPVSDTEPKRQDFQVFMSHSGPRRRVNPFPTEPINPPKDRKGSFDHKSNRNNKRRMLHLRKRQVTTGSDSDGDDEGEEDDNSPEDPDAEELTTPKSINSTVTDQPGPPATPRRVTRSQATAPTSTVPIIPSTTPISPSKRKRDSAETDTDSAQPSKGERASKRLRNSVGSSPLPPTEPSERTRGAQKKFEAKLVNQGIVFDAKHPGSVRRESVDSKSKAEKWRRVSLHDELWDGSSRSV